MTDVPIGTAIIAYIEPHEGLARAFNRWYERDHLYAATTAGPGAFSGARWVATRPCKAVRPTRATWFGDPARGSYLTTVWLLEDSQDEWDAWVARQMTKLQADADRMFSGRDHLHTAVYRFTGEARTGDGVSAATALDHPCGGLIAIAVPPGDGVGIAEQFVGPGHATAAVFRRERVILATADPPEHDLVLGFTPTDPLAAWRSAVTPLLDRVGFASPFLRTLPGTDTYTDDL